MNMSAKVLNHVNAVDSRKHAVEFINNHKGYAVYFNADKITKKTAIAAIKKGFFDGYFYGISRDCLNWPANSVVICTRRIPLSTEI